MLGAGLCALLFAQFVCEHLSDSHAVECRDKRNFVRPFGAELCSCLLKSIHQAPVCGVRARVCSSNLSLVYDVRFILGGTSKDM